MANRPGDAEQVLSFEQALERLETIVEELEHGSLSLEDSIARYEEGMKLSRQLGRTLDHAEKRIERLVTDENGAPATEPMSLDDDPPPADPAPRSMPPRAPRTATPAPAEAEPRRGPSGAGGPPELPF